MTLEKDVRVDPYLRFGKRLLDVVVSLAGLAVTWPLLVGIAVAIKVDSPGPVFYRGKRIGKGGRPFRIFKFRSMTVGAETMGPLNVGDNDSRVTRLGKFLRVSKLDELPQFISVLKGDMTLVGPRPDVPQYVALYDEQDRELILGMTPGITDWASIVNDDQYVDFALAQDPDSMFLKHIRPLKVELQRHYARSRSFQTDVRILLWTARRLLLRSRAVPDEVKPYLEIAAGRARNAVLTKEAGESG